jgi:hypothetical protein
MSEDSSQPAAETEQQPSPPPGFEPGASLADAIREKLAEANPRFEPDESLLEMVRKEELGSEVLARLESLFPAHLGEPEAERKADEQT